MKSREHPSVWDRRSETCSVSGCSGSSDALEPSILARRVRAHTQIGEAGEIKPGKSSRGKAQAAGPAPRLRHGLHFEAVALRAANSRGPGGPTGPLRTPSMTPWTLSRWGKCHRKRFRISAGTFGSTARPAAAHCVITPGRGRSPSPPPAPSQGTTPTGPGAAGRRRL